MNIIKNTLVTGFFVSAALQAKAENNFSYGIKGGISAASLYGSSVKQQGTEETKFDSSFLQTPCVTGLAYCEYAFTNYLGFELGVGYMMQGGVQSEARNQNENNNAQSKSKSESGVITHGICVPLSLCIYPVGHEEGAGIWKIFLGGSFYFPIGKPRGKRIYTDETEKSVTYTILKKEEKKVISAMDLAFQGGMAYEFAAGFFLEGRVGIGLLNRYKNEKDTKEENTVVRSSASVERKEKSYYTTLTMGYNIAALFR